MHVVKNFLTVNVSQHHQLLRVQFIPLKPQQYLAKILNMVSMSSSSTKTLLTVCEEM